MDQTNIVAQAINPLKLPIIELEASNGIRYKCDLSEFKKVSRFPKNEAEWTDVSITTQGFNLTWGNRFEIHVLQAIDSAISEEEIKMHA